MGEIEIEEGRVGGGGCGEGGGGGSGGDGEGEGDVLIEPCKHARMKVV